MKCVLFGISVMSAVLVSYGETVASKMSWDAAGYQAKVAKVNAAMPEVMKKMPLRGDVETWYNAAYQLTTTDRQFSFLKPEQRVGRINPMLQPKIDQFLAWVEGGMQTEAPAARPPVGAPSVPSGYGQPPSYANAPTVKPPMETASAGTPPSTSDVPAGYNQQPSYVNAPTVKPAQATAGGQALSNALSKEEESLFREECSKMIDEALTHKEYKLDRADLESVVFGPFDQEKGIQGHVSRAKANMCKNALEGRINAAQAEVKAMKKKESKLASVHLSRMKDLIKEGDELLTACDKAMKEYEEKAGALLPLLPKSVVEDELKHMEQLSSARGARGAVSVEVPKNDPFKAEVLGSLPSEVSAYEAGKKSNAYGESEDLKDVEQKVKVLEGLLVGMRTGINGEYGFIKTCEKVAARIESLSAEALKNAEGGFEYNLDNSGGMLTDADKAKRRDEVKKLKETLPQGEYVNKLIEMTETLKAEYKAFKEKRVVRMNLVDKLKGASVSEWKKALDAEPDAKERKLILKGVLAEVGVFDKPNKDAAELVSQYFTQEELAAAARDKNDTSNLWLGGTQFITEPTLVKSLLLEDDEWASRWRDGIPIMARQKVYYALYRNVKDQAVLLSLLDKEEINFNSCDINSYGQRDKAVFDMMSADNLKKLDNARESRRKAVKGQIVDCKGFYVGMPQRDFLLLRFEREENGKGTVDGGLDGQSMGPMENVVFDAKMRYEYLGIKKDGLEGLLEFVGKYVDGGDDSVGSPKIDATENTSWISCDSPKYDVQIRMYKDGDLAIRSTRGLGEKHKLDFSKAK